MQGVYVITATNNSNGYTHFQLAKMALKGGARYIQLRDKQLEARELMSLGNEIRDLCDEYDAKLIINDRIDLAYATDAHGVHLGQQDLPIKIARQILGPGKIIGGSASTLQEAKAVETEGADYCGFGHIYSTSTKEKSYAPRGIETLREIVRSLSIPVFAIGGINLQNAEPVVESGVSGIAVSSAVCATKAPDKSTRELAGLFRPNN